MAPERFGATPYTALLPLGEQHTAAQDMGADVSPQRVNLARKLAVLEGVAVARLRAALTLRRARGRRSLFFGRGIVFCLAQGGIEGFVREQLHVAQHLEPERGPHLILQTAIRMGRFGAGG